MPSILPTTVIKNDFFFLAAIINAAARKAVIFGFTCRSMSASEMRRYGPTNLSQQLAA